MPLSRDPEARARSLANLRKGGKPPAPPTGHTRTLRHGGYARIAETRLDTKVREIFDALAADAPLRDADGGLPAADVVTVRLLATVLCRLENIERYLSEHGWKTEDGDPRPVLDLEGRLRREALDLLEALGMTPRARVRLGIDLVRGRDLLAEVMAEGADQEGDDGAA